MPTLADKAHDLPTADAIDRAHALGADTLAMGLEWVNANAADILQKLREEDAWESVGRELAAERDEWIASRCRAYLAAVVVNDESPGTEE